MSESEISKHIFLFPFSWKYNYKKSGTLFKQHQHIKNREFEKLSSWRLQYVSIESDKDYNEFVYFYKPIRSALYTFEKAPLIVRNYTYADLAEDNEFIISVEKVEYKLRITELRLKIYKTGIGLLSFEVANDCYEALEQIEAINSFGKCIYPPILPLSKAREELFPDWVKIRLSPFEEVEEHFERNYYQESLSITPLIMKVLGDPFICRLKFFHLGKIFIEPILGNQMFCLCLYKNEEILNRVRTGRLSYQEIEPLMTLNKRGDWKRECDEETNTHYIKNNDCIYGLSRIVLLCVAKEVPKTRLYDQLISLVLMQRATLLSLSTEIARISTLAQVEIAPAIASIYEIYIQFINQLYFKEVTEDEEGGEIYEELSVQLKIREEMEQLNFEIDEVREYASLVEQAQSKIKVELLTVVGAALVIPSFVTSLFGMNILQHEITHWWDSKEVALWMNSYVFLPMLSTVVVSTWNKRKTKARLLLKIVYVLLFSVSLFMIYRYGSGL